MARCLVAGKPQQKTSVNTPSSGHFKRCPSEVEARAVSPAAGGISLGHRFDAVGNLESLRVGNQQEPPKRRYGDGG